MNPHQKILRKALEMDLGFSCTSTGALERVFDQLRPPILHRLFLIPYNRENINAVQDSPYWTDLILKDPRAFKIYSNSSLKREKKGIHIFLDSETRLDVNPWSEIDPNGFYIPQKSVLPFSGESKKNHSFITKASSFFPKANTLILGNYSAAGPNFEIRDLDIRSVEDTMEILNDCCPQLSLWLEVPAFMLSSTGVLMVKILETGEKEKRPYIRINADINAFMNDKSIKDSSNLVNLSSPNEREPVTTCITGQNQGLDNASLIIDAPTSIKEGDILSITNMGVCLSLECNNDEGRNGIPEHYLPARRICQVKF
jgi:hypothetical protein